MLIPTLKTQCFNRNLKITQAPPAIGSKHVTNIVNIESAIGKLSIGKAAGYDQLTADTLNILIPLCGHVYLISSRARFAGMLGPKRATWPKRAERRRVIMGRYAFQPGL